MTPPPTPPRPGDCHLWAWPVTSSPTLRTLLTQDEATHADTLPPGPPRATYTTSRALQRTLASHYLGIPAHQLHIDRTCHHCGAAHGRPRLPAAIGQLDYSVAHTRHWVLAAVVSQGLIGLDIDTTPDPQTTRRLSRNTLTVSEQQELARLPEAARAAAFVRLWTRKEAGSKLTGHGIAARFAHLDAAGPTLRPAGDLPAGWPQDAVHLHDLPPSGPLGTGHHAALATTSRIERILLPTAWEQDPHPLGPHYTVSTSASSTRSRTP
ncbi:4'-phosphopantetheinyl transferase family protein [Streptomyces tateyamensis]|uniref:4'-phosphopantetheinyl transferase family protein n=1 Tax=Streptomyces tateyamensis TaxID=565073 RepID=UPI0015E8E842|nr:4'-phosphopantetheinyl transferase superfamily protein [Streptomyces tateyamensis]